MIEMIVLSEYCTDGGLRSEENCFHKSACLERCLEAKAGNQMAVCSTACLNPSCSDGINFDWVWNRVEGSVFKVDGRWAGGKMEWTDQIIGLQSIYFTI